MKKSFVLFAAFVACIAFSCSKIKEDVVDPETGMKTVTITATIDEPETRTSYADGTGAFSWTAGDEISVLCTDGNLYTFTATTTGSSSAFTGSIPNGESLGDKAYFPADASHTSTKFNVPKNKDLTSHPSADIPMVGDKGVGNVFSFTHCAGAALLTIDNIPDGIESVQISIVNASLKLSGLFTIKKSGGYYYWSPESKADDNDTFIRKVSVSDNIAKVFIPYSCDETYGEMWDVNTLNITGYDNLDNPTTLVTDMTMKALGVFTRAHVKPLKPLVLAVPDFSAGVTTACGATHTLVPEMKVVADKKYLYFQFHATTTSWEDGELHLFLSDGGGESSVHWGWTTKGTAATNIEATRTITTTGISSGFAVGSEPATTTCYVSGDQTYWEIAVPRTASSLLSTTGSVYVGMFVLSKSTWDFIAAIPEVSASNALINIPLP